MPIPVRSIRLEKRSSKSLDTLSGASGEIFFDSDKNTLRIYTANNADSIIVADRQWVLENTFDGDYTSLTNKPVIPSDIRDLSDIDNRLFSGDYNDLLNAPDLDGLTVDISTIDSVGDVDTTTNPLSVGQVLQWDGSNWINATPQGFEDTNTTYSLSIDTILGGVDIVLTDSDSGTSTASIVGGTGITISPNISNQIEISTSLPALNDLSDTLITTPQDGQLLGYSSGQWINVAAPQAQGGIELTDLSVTVGAASGSGDLSYDNSLGVFTFTPPNLTSYATLSSFSITTSTANTGGSLSYSNGIFTFRPADIANLIGLTDLSVVSNAASGSGSLAYDNTTGQFTFTPPDLSGTTSDVVNDLTPQLGGNLDLNNFDIQGTGNISITGSGTFTGAVSADSFSSSATGAPTIISASTITLTAPDGVTITDGLGNDVVIDAGVIAGYEPTITAGTNAQYYRGDKTFQTLDAAAVGLGNVTNESKATMFTDPTFTGTVSGVTATHVGLGNVTNESKATMFTSPTFTGTVSGVTAAHVGLGNVTNESKATMFTDPTFTGTVSGVTATHVGLGNVTNESKATMFTSPTFTGTTTIQQTTEVTSTISGATGTVTHNLNNGAVFYHISPAANFTANFTNVPTTNNRVINVVLVIEQGLTARMPTGVQIDGSTRFPFWQGGTGVPAGTVNGIDIVSFGLFRTSAGAWRVTASATGYLD